VKVRLTPSTKSDDTAGRTQAAVRLALSEVKVLIRASARDQGETGELALYPVSTSDVVKLLRQEGAIVEYEHEKGQRALLERRSVEIWLPILDFSMNVLANIPANIAATVIMNYVKKVRGRDLKDTLLHVEIIVRDKEGNEKQVRLDGAGHDVVAALEKVDSDLRK
jgi:predicted transcriptional regulator